MSRRGRWCEWMLYGGFQHRPLAQLGSMSKMLAATNHKHKKSKKSKKKKKKKRKKSEKIGEGEGSVVVAASTRQSNTDLSGAL